MSQPTRRITDQDAHLLTLNTEPWLSCEDCFTLMDVYVETLLADPVTTAMPQMRAHLAGCAACAEEAQSLLELVTEDTEDAAGPRP